MATTLATLQISTLAADSPGLSRPPEKLKIVLTVDGTDKIFIQGTDLWIVHETFELPSEIKINGRKWDCQWDKNASDHFTGLDPAFNPKAGAPIELRKSKGRGGVQIIEKPTSENGFTACIQIADVASGADRYEFTLTWEK